MSKPNRNTQRIVITLLALAILMSTVPTFVNAAMSGPELVILSPGGLLNHSTVVPTSFVVSFLVSGFQFISPGLVGQTNQANQGHMHVFLDGVYRTLWAQPEGIPFDNIQPGTHNVTLQLVNSDHSPLSPDVEASVIVQVTAAPQGAPSLTILSPAGALNPATTVNPSFVVSFAVSNFALTDPIGQPKALNTGHIHVFLDGAYYGLWTNANPIPFIGLSPGSHTVKLQLVNNDHSALSPDVTQSITVTVSGTTSGTQSASSSIPGFPVEAVLAGALIWVGILAVYSRKRKTNQ